MTLVYKPLSQYTEQAYRDYSLYVLLDRALARYSDGLKPVQRRILYAMYELHLGPQSKPKKSVRAIGDALGKYHPHSDQAGYEALVGLAQDFSIRYPLVHGQGNFGSVDDPKSFAAMRYTEVRLSRYSPLLFDELSDSSVQWISNFDGTMREPFELPAQLPFLLINGSSGIAVGLSTEIPPHNLGQVIDALTAYLKNSKISDADLIALLQGPDFPLGGIVEMTQEEQFGFYTRGKGHFVLKATIVIDGTRLIIRSIPYMTNTTKIIEQIQNLAQEKSLLAPFELIDESDEDHPVCLSLIFKTSAQAKAAVDVLYAKTDCRVNYRCYFHALNHKGLPYCFGLKEFFSQWTQYRETSLLAQAQSRYLKCDEKQQELKVYQIAYEHLDLIFDALKQENDPWVYLGRVLSLSQKEIDILASLKLKDLSKLSMDAIYAQRRELDQEMSSLGELIERRDLRIKSMLKQLNDLKKTYADKRRSTLVIVDTLEKKIILKAPVSVSTENESTRPVCVILSTLGWIKVIKNQSVCLSDSDLGTHLRQGDSVSKQLVLLEKELVCLLDSQGRMYAIPIASLPTSKFGQHISELINLPSGYKTIFLLPFLKHYVFITQKGLMLYCELQESGAFKRGRQVMKVQEHDEIIFAHSVCAEDYIFITGLNEGEYGFIALSDLTPKYTGAGLPLTKTLNIKSVQLCTSFAHVELYDHKGKLLKDTLSTLIIKRGQLLKKSSKIKAVHLHHEK